MTHDLSLPIIDAVFDALADPLRRAAVELLAQRPYRASELAEALGVSRSRMSKHLRVLMAAGIARDERPVDDARARVFHVRPETMADVKAWLNGLQAEWDRQLESFRDYAQRSSR